MMPLNIEDEYKKYPEMKKYQSEIEKIVKWIKTQPHLPEIDERDVLLFLHAKHFHTEIAKKTIETCFTTITHCPEFFTSCDLLSEDLQRTMKMMTIFPLKKLTPEGHCVVIGRLADFDAAKFNFNDVIKLYFLCFLQILKTEHLANSFHLVADLSGITLGHVARVKLFTMKKALFYIQEAAAIRLSGLHFVNIVPFMDKILALMKPFLKEDFVNLLYVHTSPEAFYKFIPKDILPSEYGGNDESGDILKEQFYKRMQENREFFIKELAVKRVNEKLRPGKPKNISDLFGIEGNFKQLAID